MTPSFPHPAAAALLLAASLLPVQAGSLAASSAAGGSSASVGSSASSEASSAASSHSAGGRQAAALGPYRIVDVAAVDGQPGQPGQVRLQLQALTDHAPAPQHVLVLPQAIAAQHRLAAGQTITARAQAYGTEFVHDGSRQAFYLVLTDRFQRELAPQPVRL